MGRLTKVKIDQITKLRNEGYTQQETADKAGVHLRTVRKYDPVHKSSKVDNKILIENIKQAVLRLSEWVSVLSQPILSDDDLNCPDCLTHSMSYSEEAGAFLCQKCGHKVGLPIELCVNCLAHDSIRLDPRNNNLICLKCGAKQPL